MDVTDLFTMGANWIPSAGPYALMVNCLRHLCLTVVYPKSQSNRKSAEDFIENILDIVENLEQSTELTF